jgi:hypothetical protein
MKTIIEAMNTAIPMNKSRTFCLAMTLSLAAVWPLAAATVTNIWPFTAPYQYVVSDTPTIEITDGAAKLKLQSNRWVAPTAGYGCPFYGNLLSFMHLLSTNNNDTEVRYQISGNNGVNWYFWSEGKWTDVSAYTNSVNCWPLANEVAVINENIGAFCEQIDAKTGGVFKFKAFLKSDAVTPIAIEDVRLTSSSGRIVMTVPNGAEVGQDSWLIGVPYMVQWTSTGKVGGTVKLEYTLDSGTTWIMIATNLANFAGVNKYVWTTPKSASDKVRVRLTDMEDAAISDLSHSDFSIGERFRISAPSGGEKWYTGKTNVVKWESPYNLGRQK